MNTNEENQTLYNKIVQKRSFKKHVAIIGTHFFTEIKNFEVKAILSLCPGHTLQVFGAAC